MIEVVSALFYCDFVSKYNKSEDISFSALLYLIICGDILKILGVEFFNESRTDGVAVALANIRGKVNSTTDYFIP